METTLKKSDVPAIRPVDIPPVSVGRPAAEDGHATGVVFVGFNVALIGYVSFEIAFGRIRSSSSAPRGLMEGEG